LIVQGRRRNDVEHHLLEWVGHSIVGIDRVFAGLLRYGTAIDAIRHRIRATKWWVKRVAIGIAH
jgi:hypothetical protein